MKPHNYTLLLSIVSAASLSPLHGQTARTWVTGGANNNWSNTANWSGGNVPDTNAESAGPGANGGVSMNVDANFTINHFIDGFAGENTTTTVGGPGTLTIDRNLATFAVGIDNATGTTGGLLNFTGNVTIANTLSGVTSIRNANSSGNVTRFDTGSTLTLNTALQTVQSAGGQIQFNGAFGASLADLQVNSNNVSFGAGHNSSAFGRDVVLFANAKIAVTGGTVLNTGRKFQVNGAGATLQLDGANAINNANISVSLSNNFLIDVNANQESMGILADIGGTLTIDLDASVTSLWFADSSTSASSWTGGSVSINGFKENTIRFGTSSSGLTVDQLALINGGIYSLSSSGFLTAIPEPSAFAAFAGLGALGLAAARRRRR